MSTEDKETWLTPSEVARRLGVSPITIRSWVKKGWLPARTTPGGHRRFLWADVERHMRRRKRLTSSGSDTVLIVDDDAIFREYLIEALKVLAPDIKIREAIDGFQAGMMLADMSPDIVLLDFSMPGMNGDTVCRLLKSSEKHRDTTVIAMTGLRHFHTVESLQKSGADKILFKPVQLEILGQILEDYTGLEVRQLQNHNTA